MEAQKIENNAAGCALSLFPGGRPSAFRPGLPYFLLPMHPWRLFFLLLALASRPALAQSDDSSQANWLELTVVDSACRPLPGAVIIIAGTQFGTTTNADGQARLYPAKFPDSLRHRPAVLLELQQWPYHPQRLRVGLLPAQRNLGEVALRIDWAKVRAAERERALHPPLLIEIPPPEPIPVEELQRLEELRLRAQPPAGNRQAPSGRRGLPRQPARRR